MVPSDSNIVPTDANLVAATEPYPAPAARYATDEGT